MNKYKDYLVKTRLGSLDLLAIENEETFAKWKDRIDNYNKERESQINEFRIEVPESRKRLQESCFNAVEYILKLLESKDRSPLTKQYTDIVELPLSKLIARIRLGQLLAVLVLEAYIRYACVAHQLTNCINQAFLLEARKRAHFLDAYFAEHGDVIGPLHGVPISVKEHLAFKDKVTHCSYVSMLDNLPKENLATVQILHDMGAVFYVRTNQPQSLMAIDSNNNITGPTLNPYNLALSAGGSTAGEGALLACKGSIVGIGSDIGGSLRVPASFTGTYGIKPTIRRFACRDENIYGDGAIDGVYGPMCRRIADLDYFMDLYINKGQPWLIDETVIPLPWRKIDPLALPEITIAVVYDNGIVKPTPPVVRAMDYVVSKLEKAGIKVITFNPPKPQEAAQCIDNLYHAYGTSEYIEPLQKSGEPILKLTQWQLGFGKGNNGLDPKLLQDNTKFKNEMARAYFDYANANNITAILGPIGESVAPESDNGFNWSYTNIYNLIDWPAVAFPTGLCQDPSVDQWDALHEKYNYFSDLERYCHQLYYPQKSKGAPIGLQLAGRPFQDELVVAVVGAITTILDIE